MDYSFEINSPKMHLCVTPNYTTVVFEGHGRIWIDKDGQMRFRMQAISTGSSLEREWLPRLRIFGMPPQAMSIKEDEYLQLRAYDIKGHEWITDWLIPSIDFNGKYVDLWGQIANITTFQKTGGEKQDESANFVIFRPPRLPFTMSTMTKKEQDGEIAEKSWVVNRQTVKLNNLSVCFEEIDNIALSCDIRPLGDKPLLNQIATHVIEALRFMTSTVVQPIYCRQSRPNGNVLNIEGNIAAIKWESNLVLPLAARKREDHEKQWLIFKAYLEYLVCGSDKLAEFHSVSREYNGAMWASRQSLEGFALSLGVAVEAMLKICQKPFEGLELFLSEQLANVDGLIEHISNWGDDEKKDIELRNRTISAVLNFKDITAKDKLRYLKEGGKITGRDIKAWTDLRNKSAHGGAYREPDKNRMLELITIVSGLLHRIVLIEIGYDGPFTNYSNNDWPLITWDNLKKSNCPPETK